MRVTYAPSVAFCPEVDYAKFVGYAIRGTTAREALAGRQRAL